MSQIINSVPPSTDVGVYNAAPTKETLVQVRDLYKRFSLSGDFRSATF